MAWQVLLATWASMRFDDLLLVEPASARITEEAFYFTALKSKKGQARRGTKVVVCNVALAAHDWLSTGFAALSAAASPPFWSSDFFLCQTDGVTTTWDVPISYAAFVSNFKFVCDRAVRESSDPEIIIRRTEFLQTITKFTGHSPRPTIVNAMAHEGQGILPIQLQGKWAPERMVLKYVRDRSGMQLSHVHQIAADMRKQWEEDEAANKFKTKTEVEFEEEAEPSRDGGQETETDNEGDESDAEDAIFWATAHAMKVTKPARVIIHVSSSITPGQLACNRVPASLLRPIREDDAALWSPNATGASWRAMTSAALPRGEEP